MLHSACTVSVHKPLIQNSSRIIQVRLANIDPLSVSKHCEVFLSVELRWRQKDPLTASLTVAMKFVSLFFNNNWRNSEFTCICKVTHCPGPQLLFEKVNFNGQNQIGRPAHALTQRK